MNNLNLSSPWEIYYSKLCALFQHDTEITLDFDRDAYMITITSTDKDKADALSQIIPSEVEFGNVILSIDVVSDVPAAPGDLYKRAFKDNPVLAGVETYPLPSGDLAYFAEFKNKSAYFYADDIENPRGLMFELYQDVAKDVLNHEDIFITSSTGEEDFN